MSSTTQQLLLSYPRKVSVSYAGTPTADTADLTTYTFSSAAIGTAAWNRVVVVAFCSRANAARTVTGATIGGSAATLAATANDAVGGADITTMWYLPVPAGTTATLTVTFSGAMLRCSCFVWAVYGSTATFAPFDTQTDTGATMSVSAPAAANGAILAAAWSTATNAAFTWTGVNEDAENNPESVSNVGGAAHIETTSSSNINVVATNTGTSVAQGSLVTASFRG